jgi:hypothetical protein
MPSTYTFVLIVAAALIVPANAGPKIEFRACKFKVMQDVRYLTGKSRNICGAQCAAAINQCMANGGKIYR